MTLIAMSLMAMSLIAMALIAMTLIAMALIPSWRALANPNPNSNPNPNPRRAWGGAARLDLLRAALLDCVLHLWTAPCCTSRLPRAAPRWRMVRRLVACLDAFMMHSDSRGDRTAYREPVHEHLLIGHPVDLLGSGLGLGLGTGLGLGLGLG